MTMTGNASSPACWKFLIDAAFREIVFRILPCPACLYPNVKRFFSTPDLGEQRHEALTDVRTPVIALPTPHASWVRRRRQIAGFFAPQAAPGGALGTGRLCSCG